MAKTMEVTVKYVVDKKQMKKILELNKFMNEVRKSIPDDDLLPITPEEELGILIVLGIREKIDSLYSTILRYRKKDAQCLKYSTKK